MSREREELKGLIESVIAMADEVGGFLKQAADAFLASDTTVLDGLYAKDEAIDRMENAIDARCLRILALYQPAADDLRTVFMCLKINNDLERIGDHALNIAERAADMPFAPEPTMAEPFSRMRELDLGMLGDCVTSFVARDAPLAKSVLERDDEADELFRRVVQVVVSRHWQGRPEREAAVALVFAAKEFERIADLCTNLAEDVVFIAEGTTLKHEGQM
jgi:phosphate transport system protein